MRRSPEFYEELKRFELRPFATFYTSWYQVKDGMIVDPATQIKCGPADSETGRKMMQKTKSHTCAISEMETLMQQYEERGFIVYR